MTDYALPSAGGGDKLDLGALNGALLLIEVTGQDFGVVTSFGTSDPVRGNVVALDGSLKGSTYTDTLFFPKVLISQLKGSVGKKVLARLGRGVAKPGQSAPWTLNPPTEDDKAIARKYEAHAATQAAAQDEPW